MLWKRTALCAVLCGCQNGPAFLWGLQKELPMRYKLPLCADGTHHPGVTHLPHGQNASELLLPSPVLAAATGSHFAKSQPSTTHMQGRMSLCTALETVTVGQPGRTEVLPSRLEALRTCTCFEKGTVCRGDANVTSTQSV